MPAAAIRGAAHRKGVKQLHDLYQTILADGRPYPDRTGTGSLGVFCPPPLTFDLADGFPLQTTKRVFVRGVFVELMFFLRGEHDTTWLTDRGVHIWDQWRSRLVGTPGFPDTELGPVYGVQWRHFGGDLADWTPGLHRNREPGRDQLASLLDGLRADPFGRRHVMTTWNPTATPDMALPPCHGIETQLRIEPGDDGLPARLDLSMYQRSADTFLGLPFNIASYAFLLHLLAREVGLTPGRLTLLLGDAHIYRNHLEQVATVLSRTPRPLPTLRPGAAVREHDDDLLPSYDFDRDVAVDGYDPYPAVKAPVAV